MKNIIFLLLLLLSVEAMTQPMGRTKTEVKLVTTSNGKLEIEDNESLSDAIEYYGDTKALEAWNEGEVLVSCDTTSEYNKWGVMKREVITNFFLIKTIDPKTKESVLIKRSVDKPGEWEYSFKVLFFLIVVFIASILKPRWRQILNVKDNKDIVNIHIRNTILILIVFFVALPFNYLNVDSYSYIIPVFLVCGVIAFVLGMFFTPNIILFISIIWLLFVPSKLFIIIMIILLIIVGKKIGKMLCERQK